MKLTPSRMSLARKRQVLVLVAGIGAFIYVIASVTLDGARITSTVTFLGWTGCSEVLALSVLNYALRFLRWKIILQKFGHRIPTFRHLLFYLCGFALTVSPAKAGEAVRSWYLHDYGVSYSQSVAALFFERILDVAAIVVLATLVVIDRSTYLPLVTFVPVLIAAAFILMRMRRLPAQLRRFAKRISSQAAARVLSTVANLLDSSRVLFTPSLLTFGGSIGVVSWGAEGVGLYLICRGLHLNLAPLTAMGVYGMAVLAGNAAFFLPAGIGSTEVSMVALLASYGASLGSAVTATLLCRLATLCFATAIGVVSAGVIELRPKPVQVGIPP